LILTGFPTAFSSDDLTRESFLKATATGILRMPDQVAGLLLFPVSPAGSYVTGQAILVDGGIHV